MDGLQDRIQHVVLETDRLRFATWVQEDWKDFQRLATDPLVVRYLGNGVPWTEERVREFVNRQCESSEKRGFCLWKLLPKDGDTLLGICGLQQLAEGPDVEIGWWLAPSHWGQGLATEAARQALAYGFEVANLDRVVAIAQAANRDSLRVMEKIGMRFEREGMHRGLRVVLYTISRESYFAGKEKAQHGA